MPKIKPYSRLLPREQEIDLCDHNENVLSLGEVVQRWTENGQFMMTEVNHSDSYEGKTNELNSGDIIGRISKIESYLMGIKAVNEIQAQQHESKPAVSQPATPAPATTE